MKKTLVFLTLACILSTLSCTLSTSQKENKREDVLGVWEATKESLKKQNQDKVFSFELNADSTVIICRDGLTQEKSKGKWLWNFEKKLGNSKLGISFKSDVIFDIDSSHRLGLLLEKRAGNLYLSAEEYEFKKKN